MLYVLGFTRLGVVLSDLYFADPYPEPGQEGAERGVRLEVRYMELAELRAAGPEIVDMVTRLLQRINDGQLGREPADADTTVLVRSGWL